MLDKAGETPFSVFVSFSCLLVGRSLLLHRSLSRICVKRVISDIEHVRVIRVIGIIVRVASSYLHRGNT